MKQINTELECPKCGCKLDCKGIYDAILWDLSEYINDQRDGEKWKYKDVKNAMLSLVKQDQTSQDYALHVQQEQEHNQI